MSRDDDKHRTDLTIEANKAAASEAARLHGLLGLAIRKLPTAAADEGAWLAVGGEAFDLAVAIINVLNLPAETAPEPEAPSAEDATPLPPEPPARKSKSRR